MPRPSIPPGGTGEANPVEVRRGLWSVRVRWRDTKGKAHETTANGPTRKACLTALDERVAEKRKRIEAPEVAPLLETIAEAWLDSLLPRIKEGTITDSTIAQYRACWDSTLARVFGDVDVNHLTRRQAQEGLDGLRRRDHKGNLRLDENGKSIPLVGPQPRAVLKMILEFAADRGYQEDHLSVLAGTKNPRRVKAPTRALTENEWQQLIDLAETAATKHQRATWDLHDALLLAHYTGTRIGEVCATEWQHVHLDADPPTVGIKRTTREPRKNVAPLGPTKGKKTPTYALHPRAVAMLRRRLASWDGSTPFVYGTGKQGRPVQSGNLRTRLRALVEGTDLAWVHPHSLRATLATAAERQVGLAATAELLAHSDEGAIAAKHYVVVDGERVLDPRGLFED